MDLSVVYADPIITKKIQAEDNAGEDAGVTHIAGQHVVVPGVDHMITQMMRQNDDDDTDTSSVMEDRASDDDDGRAVHVRDGIETKDSWPCALCTFINSGHAEVCGMCEAKRSHEVCITTHRNNCSIISHVQVETRTWQCPKCTLNNVHTELVSKATHTRMTDQCLTCYVPPGCRSW